MPRALTSNTKAESVAKIRAQVWFVFLDFYSGPVYVWSGVGDVTWNGHTWKGMGEFGSVTGLAESTDTQAAGPTFTLNGVPNDMLALIFADNYNGRVAQAWLGFRNLATDAIVADPYPIFSGRMERLEIDPTPETSTVRVTAESKNYAPGQADDRRFNDADQQIDFPGDTFFDKLASVGQRPIMWPGADSPGVTDGAGGGGGDGNNYEN
jgi:hypothetical protein